MNSSEKNYHFKYLIQLKVGVGPESELELDNRNFPESESDDGTSDSTALVRIPLKFAQSYENIWIRLFQQFFGIHIMLPKFTI